MEGSNDRRRGVFWILVGASALAGVASVPYVEALFSQVPLDGRRIEMRGAFPFLFFAIQALILTIPTAWIGLRLAPRTGLRLVVPPLGRGIRHGIVVGLAIGVALIAISVGAEPYLPQLDLRPPAWWKGLLGSASAGVNEEIWFRLGVMTALVAAGQALFGRPAHVHPGSVGTGDGDAVPPDGEIETESAVEGESASPPRRAPSWVFWTASVIASLLFGAMHLPQAAAITSLTPQVVGFTLLGNGIAGVAFGWLYWKHGLVSAMTGHFATDIVLHVIAPLAEG